MVYGERGPRGSDAFVLVHGIGMGRHALEELAEELGRHARVFAVDLPGFGDSPEPGTALDMAASGLFLAEFVAGLPVSDPVLVGHSMGTQVVVEALVGAPGLCTRAVLIAPTVNERERTAAWQAWRMVQDLAIESPRVLLLGMVEYAKAGPRWFLSKLRQMLAHRVEDVLPLVRARVLVLRGADDRVCPSGWTAHVADLIPGATLQEIPGRGHEAMIRNAQPAADLILRHARADRPERGRSRDLRPEQQDDDRPTGPRP